MSPVSGVGSGAYSSLWRGREDRDGILGRFGRTGIVLPAVIVPIQVWLVSMSAIQR